ncbi:MAG: divalent-cation tolerance protein CutA [Alphaproteobacteria bacterium]|nr:divalent-cation tolerance protein CutA [Alphaproteobacteria bacterium]
MQTLLVYATFENEEQAGKIARILLEKRLIACANIFPPHQSLYEWQGEIKNEKETAALFKTTSENFEALRETILKHHSYECPCIMAWGIQHGHPPFLQWIKEQTDIEK